MAWLSSNYNEQTQKLLGASVTVIGACSDEGKLFGINYDGIRAILRYPFDFADFDM